MTNQQYISIAKLLEQNNPELFEQLNLELCQVIDVEALFKRFCEALSIFPVNIIGKPYNRVANKNKALFVGVLITELKTEKLPRGMKKQLAKLLDIDKRKIGETIQNVNIYLKTYCDFKLEVDNINSKILSL